MAGGSLLEALISNKYQYQNDPYAASGGAVANNLGSLVNPYGSVGKNAAVTLGAGVLAGLLGNYGRNRVDRQNAEYFKQAQALRFAEPEQRAAIVNSEPRLADFGGALLSQDQEIDNQIRLLELENKRKIDFERDKARTQAIYENYPQLALGGQLPSGGEGSTPLVNTLAGGFDSNSRFTGKEQRELQLADEKDNRKRQRDLKQERLLAEQETAPKLDMIAKAYDVAADVGFADIQNPWSTEGAKFEAAQSSIMPALQSMWKGPMSDSDMKRLEGLLPKSTDTKERLAVKKKQMLEVVKSNAGIGGQGLSFDFGSNQQVQDFTPEANTGISIQDVANMTPEEAQALLSQIGG